MDAKCLKKVGTVFAKYISEMKIKQKQGRSANMKKILIATHGTFASGAESTVKFLMGDVGNITCINAYVDQDENLAETLRQVHQALRALRL